MWPREPSAIAMETQVVCFLVSALHSFTFSLSSLSLRPSLSLSPNHFANHALSISQFSLPPSLWMEGGREGREGRDEGR